MSKINGKHLLLSDAEIHQEWLGQSPPSQDQTTDRGNTSSATEPHIKSIKHKVDFLRSASARHGVRKSCSGVGRTRT